MTRAVLLVAVTGVSCVRPDVVACGDAICPLGALCLAEEARCVDPTLLDVDTSELVFDVPCGTTREEVVTLRNHSDEPIAFTARSTQASIQPSLTGGVVAPGSSLDLVILADPGAASIPGMEVDGVITIASATSSSSIDVEMTSHGAIATIAGTLDFGETGIDVPKQRVIRIRNDGNAEMTAAITDPPQHVASLVDFAQSILPGSEVSFPFVFEAPAIDEYDGAATLEIQGDLCQPAPAQLPFRAVTSGDVLLVDATAIEFPAVNCGTAEDRTTLALTNNRGDPLTVTVTSSDSWLISTAPSITIPPLSTVGLDILRRQTTTQDMPGTHVTTLTLSAQLSDTETIEKTVTVEQAIVAPRLVAGSTSLMLTPTSLTGTIAIANMGNATAQVRVFPPASEHITASPELFQIPANSESTITFLADPVQTSDELRTALRTTPSGACGSVVMLYVRYSQLF